MFGLRRTPAGLSGQCERLSDVLHTARRGRMRMVCGRQLFPLARQRLSYRKRVCRMVCRSPSLTREDRQMIAAIRAVVVVSAIGLSWAAPGSAGAAQADASPAARIRALEDGHDVLAAQIR